MATLTQKIRAILAQPSLQSGEPSKKCREVIDWMDSQGIEISDSAVYALAAIAFTGQTPADEVLRLANAGTISKSQLEIKNAGVVSAVTESKELPGHVLDSEKFKESFYSAKVEDETVWSALLEKASKTERVIIENTKLTPSLLKAIAEVNQKVRDAIFTPEALAQIQELENKEKETLELLEWLKPHSYSAVVFRERAVSAVVSSKVCNQLTKLVVLPNAWERVEVKSEKDFGKSWSALNDKGGLLYQAFQARVEAEVDGELTEVSVTRFKIVLAVPPEFKLPEFSA